MGHPVTGEHKYKGMVIQVRGRLKILLCKKNTVVKSEEVKTKWSNL
jgi:hypothetical protein